MPDSNRTPRRRHSAELKQQVLSACHMPGGAGAGAVPAAGQRDAFIALTMTPSAASATTTPAPDIRIELRRGAMAVHVAWPLAAAGDCAAWLRELLR